MVIEILINDVIKCTLSKTSAMYDEILSSTPHNMS